MTVRMLVDSDSMSAQLRAIVERAAERHDVKAFFVANRSIPVRSGSNSRNVVADDADEWIVGEAVSGDLAITRDIPLAARLVALGVDVVTDRGEHLTSENIANRSSERDLAMGMREAGVLRDRGRAYRQRDVQAFANALDRVLTSRRPNRGGGIS